MTFRERDVSSQEPSAFPVEPGKETWQTYFNSRFPAAFSASSVLGGQLAYQGTYLDLLGQTADHFTRKGRVDWRSMGEEEAEVFLAVCDAWVATELQPALADSEVRKRYLATAIRYVSGLLAFDDDSFKSEVLGNVKEVTEWSERLVAYRNDDLTQRLHDNIIRRDNTSFAYETRRLLGICPSDTEQPYKTLVVDLSQQKTSGRLSPWEDVTGLVGSRAFTATVTSHSSGPGPTIVFASEDVQKMFAGDEEENKKAQATAAHEYVHTQRNYLVGFPPTLGHHLNEFAATILSGTASYKDTQVLMGLMHGFSDWKMYPKLQEAAKDLSKTGSLYRFISDNLGFQSLLYLVTTAPEGYSDEGLEVPGIDSRPGFRTISLINHLTKEALKRNPNLPQQWETTAPPYLARHLVDMSIEGDCYLPFDLQFALMKRFMEQYSLA
jgi:hypothetical protein